MMTTRDRWLPWQLAAILLLSTAGLARADCPNPADICECVGEAKNFNLVATKDIRIGDYRQVYYGYPYFTQAYVQGNICTNRVNARGHIYYPTYLGDDVLLLRGPGSWAAKIRKHGDRYGYGGYGVTADLIATGGGHIRGEENLSVYEVDTSGTHPGLDPCEQAIVDMESASAALAALTPTQDLGRINIRGEYVYIEAGPGVAVLQASRISVRPIRYEGYPEPGWLYIEWGPETEAVIINTSDLRVGDGCQVYSDGPQDKTIINVPGKGRKVYIEDLAFVEPPILAPQRPVRVGHGLGDYAVNNVMGKRIRLKGSTAHDLFSHYCY
jgi:hypothetical protein